MVRVTTYAARSEKEHLTVNATTVNILLEVISLKQMNNYVAIQQRDAKLQYIRTTFPLPSSVTMKQISL